MAKNYPGLNKHYIVTRRTDDYITLKKYLDLNRNAISLETKLKIMSQILCFAHICLAKMSNLVPSFSLTNLMINRYCSLQLESIQCTAEDPFMELLQTLYRVLMMKNCFVELRDKMYTKVECVMSLEDWRVQHIGPSSLIKILLRSISNLPLKD